MGSSKAGAASTPSGTRPRVARAWRWAAGAALLMGLVVAPTRAGAAPSPVTASINCRSDLPATGPLDVTQVMAPGTSGFLQLGFPASGIKNKFIGTCVLTGTIPSRWTVDMARFSTLAANSGAGNAGTLKWDASQDDAAFTDAGTFTNSGTFADDATGFVQSIAVSHFVNTGAVVSNGPGLGTTGTTGNPSCPACTFLNRGAVVVAAKDSFASGSVFELEPGATIRAAGEFDIANESTFEVLGGTASGGLVTGQFLGQGAATIDFAPEVPAGSEGKVDVATSAKLVGVVPRHWTIEDTNGSIAASNAGNAGTFLWGPSTDNSVFSDTTPFVNSGTFTDDAVGFVQDIQVPRFVNTGTVTANGPGFAVSAPTGAVPIFVDQGSLVVGPKGNFSALGVFDLKGSVVNHGGFGIDGTTLSVDGGSASGKPLSATYHLGAQPAAVEFRPGATATSGAIDTGMPTTLEGVVPRHWALDAIGGPGTAITALHGGNDGTIYWDASAPLTSNGTFTNAGSVIVRGSGMRVSSSQLANGPGGRLVLTGNGASLSLAGSLSNQGLVSLGPGRVTVSNAFAQSSSGALAVSVVGASESGSLAIGGAASLNGSLEVQRSPGYRAHAGDSQQVISDHGTDGRFGRVTGTADGAGLRSVVVYTSTGVALDVKAGAH